MFDIFSWQHILILLVAALVVVGPKDLPRLMHMAGRWAGKARGMANEFKKSFDDMARQSELEELRKEIEALRQDHNLNTDIADALGRPFDHDEMPDGAPASPMATPAPQPASQPVPRAGEYQVTETASGGSAAP